MTQRTYTLAEVWSAVEQARKNWDDHVYEEYDDARTAARIGAVTVLDYLPDD